MVGNILLNKIMEEKIRKIFNKSLFLSDIENYVEIPTDVIYDDLLKHMQSLYEKDDDNYPETLDMDRDALIRCSAYYYSKVFRQIFEKYK